MSGGPIGRVTPATIDRKVPTLPRLGSGVRIPSPAPKFSMKTKRLRNALRGVSCFQRRCRGTVEAEWKHLRGNPRIRHRRRGVAKMRGPRVQRSQFATSPLVTTTACDAWFIDP